MTPEKIERDRAPERIWIDAERTYSATSFSAGIKYIRADLHDAEVQRLTAERDAALALTAAAYEAAGVRARHLWYDSADADETELSIKNLTPADALAAQAARDERMRAEGMATAYAKAQQAIADLPYPKDEAAVNEQENCYRAVEALATLEKHHE